MTQRFQRIYFIDIAKTIAIVLVVIGHFIPAGSPQWWVDVRTVIYTFHMPLFFFASGFLFAYTERPMPYRRFLQHKAQRLMLPYLTASVLIICFKLLTERGTDVAAIDNPVTPMAFLQMFWEPSAGYFLWFIWALMWMFVVAGLFRGKRARLWLLAVGVVLAYEPYVFTRLFCINQAREMFVYFMLGAVVSDSAKLIANPRLNCRGTVLCVSVFVLFAVLEWMLIACWQNSVVLRALLPYVGIAAMMALSVLIDYGRPNRIKASLLYLAPYSYFIYLFHTTFEGVAKALLLRVPLFERLDGLVFALLAFVVVAVGIVGPVFVYKWIVARFRVLRVAFGQ